MLERGRTGGGAGTLPIVSFVETSPPIRNDSALMYGLIGCCLGTDWKAFVSEAERLWRTFVAGGEAGGSSSGTVLLISIGVNALVGLSAPVGLKSLVFQLGL